MPVAFSALETDNPSETALVNLFGLSGDLLVTAGFDGRFRQLSSTWETTLGWTKEELTAGPFIDLVHPDDREATLQVVAEVAAGNEVVNFENRHGHKDGSWRWLVWAARSDGEAWFAVAKDVTDHKSLEQRVIHDALTGLPNRTLLLDRLDARSAA